MAQVDIQADLSKLLNDLSRVESAVQSLQAEMRKTGQVGQQAFNGAAAESHQFLEDVNLVGEAMRKAGQQVKSLDDYLAHLERQQKRTNDPAMVRKYADEIGRTRKALAEIKAAGYDEEFGKINKGATTGTSVFLKMSGALAAIGGIQALSQLATDALAASDDFKKASTSFTAFLGSKEKASDFIGNLDLVGLKLDLTTDQTRSAAKSLLAFGESQSNIEPVMRRIADLSVATGKDFNELALIYGKARTQGVLYAEDINQLTEAGIPIMSEFAKVLGTSTGNVKKLASEGKIGFADLEKAFINMTAEGTKFGGLAAKQAKEFGAVTSATSAWKGALVGIGEFLTPLRNLIANTFAGLSKVVQYMTGNYDAFKEKTVDVTRETKNLQASFNLEIDVLKRANLTQDERKKVIGEINEKYKDYLPKLLTEKSSIEDIEAAQAGANREFLKKIILLDTEEKIRQRIEAGIQAAEGSLALKKSAVAKQNTDPQDNARYQQALNDQAAFLTSSANQQKAFAEATAKDIDGIKKGAIDAAAIVGISEKELTTALDKIGRDRAASTEGSTGGDPEKAAKQAKANAEFVEAAKIAAMEEGLQKQLALEDLNYQKSLDGKGFNKAQLEELERIHQQNIREIIAKSAAAELKKAQELADEEERLRKEADAAEGKDRLEKLEAIKANGERQVALNEENQKSIILSLKKLGATDEQIKKAQEQFDLESQKARLENELNFQEALLEITDAGDTARINEIAGNIELLKSKIRNAQGEIDNANTSPDNPKSFIESIFGELSNEELGALKQAAGQIVGSIGQITAAQIDSAQAARDAADARVEAAQTALDKELELQKQGFANNVSLRQQELADAESAQKQAISRQQKAAKIQLAADSVQQASGIISASVNLYKTWSTLPFGVGLLAAGAQVAAMIALIASIRSKARAISSQQFRHGGSGYVDQNGVIVGNSHENGGVTVPEYEGGEFFGSDGQRFAVVNKRMTGKHFDLLTAINRDDRDGIRRHAFGLTGGISVKREAFEAGTRPVSAVQTVVGGTDRSEEVSLLREQNRHLKTLVDRKQIHDMGDYFLIIEGDKQTKIQKNG
jgi:tape measure domain-containing protein